MNDPWQRKGPFRERTYRGALEDETLWESVARLVCSWTQLQEPKNCQKHTLDSLGEHHTVTLVLQGAGFQSMVLQL